MPPASGITDARFPGPRKGKARLIRPLSCPRSHVLFLPCDTQVTQPYRAKEDYMDQQLEFTYEPEDSFFPDEISERISREGADNVSTHDLASLVFADKAPEAIEVLHSMVSGNGDIKNLPTDNMATVAAMELLRRISSNKACRSPEEVFRLIQHYAYDSPYQEVFGIISLNGAHEVIRPVVITHGLLNRTLIAPRECFLPAIQDHAAALVLFHTHPSGNTEPSSDDLETTYRLRKAGQILGIEILDHILVTKTGYHSMAESGELL